MQSRHVTLQSMCKGQAAMVRVAFGVCVCVCVCVYVCVCAYVCVCVTV